MDNSLPDTSSIDLEYISLRTYEYNHGQEHGLTAEIGKAPKQFYVPND
jgi:hypothetical protein